MGRLIRVAVAQRSAAGTTQQNLTGMIDMVKEAVSNRSNLDVIVFPEYSYYAPTNIEESRKVAEDVPGPLTETMGELARKYSVNIIPGSFVEKAEGGKVHNTCVFINRDGKIVGKYRKIHLMDAIGYKESDYVEAGKQMCVIDTDIGRVGIMVCYDLRFPELARSMVLQGSDILFVPSEFPSGNPLPPRTDHWDILVRSTALYNLTYVVAANQFGPLHNDNPFGRSCVVDPWGTVISSASGRQDIIYATLDMDYQKYVRDSVATWVNRKPEIYAL
jgi:predicted amidohydrolase